MPEFLRLPLREVLDEKGYIRGPFGSALVRSELRDFGIPVYEQQHAISGTREFRFFVSDNKYRELIRFEVKPNDLIISCSGTIGRVSIIRNGDSKGIISQALLILRPDPGKVTPQFLYYFLRSYEGQHELVQASHGTVQVNIAPRSVVEQISIPVPPLNEQRAIAYVLSTLDDKIELNRHMNETLEATARAIFKSWFVDFDPVRAKASGEPTDSICHRIGLTPDLLALFPSGFQDSDRGEIPAGWQSATVTALAEINARTLSKNDKLDLIEYVEISEVSRGDIGTIQIFKRGEEPSRARRRLRHGDTVLSTVRPERGSYFLCLNPSQNLIASTGFAVITPTKVPWSFVYTALTQPEVFQHLGHQADGGAYPAIRPEIIGDIEFVLTGNTSLLNAFHSVCGPLYQQAEHNRHESQMLAGLRDTLLPKLLSGEIRFLPQGAA